MHVTHVFSLIQDTSKRHAPKSMLHVVLESQFIKFHVMSYYICQGTGQGMTINGNLADITFHEVVERHIVTSRLHSEGIQLCAPIQNFVTPASQ